MSTGPEVIQILSAAGVNPLSRRELEVVRGLILHCVLTHASALGDFAVGKPLAQICFVCSTSFLGPEHNDLQASRGGTESERLGGELGFLMGTLAQPIRQAG